MLDVNSDGTINETEKNLFRRGPAYSATVDGVEYKSHVPFLNYGDPLHNLYNFVQTIKNSNKRIYLSVMYKDSFNMPEGENAQFTIKSINERAATSSETTSLIADKTITEGDITATLSELNLHAGVYPSMVKGLTTATAESKEYAKAVTAVADKGTELGKKYDVVKFVGEVQLKAGLVNVELLGNVNLTYKTAKADVQIFKVSNKASNALDEVTLSAVEGGYSFEVEGGAIYAVYYKNASGNGGQDKPAKKGCRGIVGGEIGALVALMGVAVVAISKKRAK
jgi:hypothetical protein